MNLLLIRRHVRSQTFANRPDTTISGDPWPRWTRRSSDRALLTHTHQFTYAAKWYAGDFRVTRFRCACGAIDDDWELID